MEERQTLRQATKLWQEAYRYQMEGELDCAIEATSAPSRRIPLDPELSGLFGGSH